MNRPTPDDAVYLMNLANLQECKAEEAFFKYRESIKNRDENSTKLHRMWEDERQHAGKLFVLADAAFKATTKGRRP